MVRPTFIRTAAIWMAVAILIATAAAAAAEPGEDPAPVTLADALALTLEKSPDLAAYSWDVRAAEARQIQARLRPNPELAVQVEDVRLGSGPTLRTREQSYSLAGGDFSLDAARSSETGARSGFSEAEFTISLSQLIELGGKRAKRIRLAESNRDLAGWDYEAARAEALKNTAQAFVAVLAAQERLDLDRELVGLAEQVYATVSARVKAGRVSPLEAIRSETELSAAKVEANASEGRLGSARSALAALWGDEEARFSRAEGSLDEVRQIPPLDELRGRIENNPDLARWRDEVEMRRHALALEKSNAVPDITVVAGFRTRGMPKTDGETLGIGLDGVSFSRFASRADADWENSVVLGVSVPLPLFNRNQGSILEADYVATKTGEQRRAAYAQANARLTASYQDLATAYATVNSLKEDILPAVTETFNAVSEAYKQGKLGYLDVLDAQQRLFGARHQYLDALAAWHQSAAEIERAVGEPVWTTAAGKASHGKD